MATAVDLASSCLLNCNSGAVQTSMTGSRFSLRVASCLRAADNLATGRQSANYKRPIGANGRLMSGHSEVASGAVRIRYSGRKSGTWALPQIGDISVEQMQSTRFPGPKKKESGRSSWQRTDAFRRAIRYRKSAAAGRKMKLEGNARCKAAESTADM